MLVLDWYSVLVDTASSGIRIEKNGIRIFIVHVSPASVNTVNFPKATASLWPSVCFSSLKRPSCMPLSLLIFCPLSSLFTQASPYWTIGRPGTSHSPPRCRRLVPDVLDLDLHPPGDSASPPMSFLPFVWTVCLSFACLSFLEDLSTWAELQVNDSSKSLSNP